VLNFRLVYDNDTGRPKGFGFAEFADTDSAASAVRNLNNFEIMGRELRVDFSHVGGKDDAAPVGYNAQQQQQQQQQPPAQAQPPNGYLPPPAPGALPPLPPGVDLQPGITCPDAISKTLSTLPMPQLLDVLKQMKGLVMGDPARATELLKQSPQLSYAIFQALLLMNLVDTSVLGSVVEQVHQQPPQPPIQQQQQQQPQIIPPPRLVPTYQPPPPQQQQQQYPPYQQMPLPMHQPTPPVHSQPYQQPPPIQQPPPPQVQPGQEELLKQVLAMPQHQVDQLPPPERSQIMMLRQQFGGQRF